MIISADDKRFAQVISILMSNAIKFTENGKIKLYLNIGPQFLTVKVHDTGKGLEQEEQETIFELSRILQNAGKRHAKRKGLGLIIAAAIVKEFKGSIKVESNPMQGSTFEFTIEVSQTRKKKAHLSHFAEIDKFLDSEKNGSMI